MRLEGGGGKIKLLRAGAYKDNKVDVSLITYVHQWVKGSPLSETVRRVSDVMLALDSVLYIRDTR